MSKSLDKTSMSDTEELFHSKVETEYTNGGVPRSHDLIKSL